MQADCGQRVTPNLFRIVAEYDYLPHPVTLKRDFRVFGLDPESQSSGADFQDGANDNQGQEPTPFLLCDALITPCHK
jgi:hypothetical protein